MKLFKRHKGLFIIGSLTLVLLIVIFIIFSRMIFSSSKNKYGDRLKNVVSLDSKVIKEIVDENMKEDIVQDIDIHTSGKIIYTTIKVNNGTSKDAAKELASKTLSHYSDKILECYDFEFLILMEVEVNESEEDPSYAIAGTKTPDREKISWTRK